MDKFCKKKRVISVSDIENILFGLNDSGKGITEEKIIKELESDFRKSNRQVPISAIESAVRDYFEKTFDN